MHIKIDEKSVFNFCKEDWSIHLWDHQDGPLTGPIIGETGSIQFASKKQAYQFKEMMDLMVGYDEDEYLMKSKLTDALDNPQLLLFANRFENERLALEIANLFKETLKKELGLK